MNKMISQATLSKMIRTSAVVRPATRSIHTSRRPFLPRRWMTDSPDKNKTAIVFPGQGSQYVGMGKDFHEEFACAREVFQEVDESLGFNLSKLMFEGDQATLTQTSNAQPAIVTTSIAAIRIMQKEFGFDIKSEAHFALGHSLGEYSALVATESLSLKDAVNIVRCRGASMQDCVKDLPRKTVMSAIVLKRDSLRDLEDAMESIQTLLPPGEVAELANINSSHQAVLSGTAEGVNFASRILKDHKIALKAIDLPVSAPFHCSLMKGARGPVEGAFEGVQIQKPIVPVVFNATCRPLMSGSNCPSELIKSHLLHQIDNTVPWYYSIQFCKQSGVNRFITLGPNKVVGNLILKRLPHRLDKVFTFHDKF
ncbi:[acyl-carrier-protein] S-malonyltransferase, variant 2 [Entomophthora muscae]|uniref:[acyl-carrier-protein] S-malonyltransferase, variant 2 n=1 Tax=Entomophthora muscae TaxID=34485 RepID=A0ACC2RZQ7_9FUNG|nr:[acyl-carrier-protein] S-malonyltransferase, variant 2 [Entomophthora muscae]